MVVMTKLSSASSLVRARSDELDAEFRNMSPFPSSAYICIKENVHNQSSLFINNFFFPRSIQESTAL